MANKSTVYLTDKDIRNLEIKPKRYKKAVGEPKELYIWVNPKGSKVFFIKYKDESNKEQSITIQEFREGIYSVKEARNEARYILNQIYNGKTLQEIKNSDKYIFKNLFYRYVDIKKDKVSENYLKKMINRINLHIMPSLANMDVKDIKSTMLRDLLNPLFNRDNPNKSRLETIHRTIRDLKAIFSFALRDGYITIDPTIGLASDFPTSYSFAKNRGVDTRLPAIIDNSALKEFLIDLKNDNSMDLQTKRAIYLQILTTNRPINTAEAKWEDIDLENKIWTISAEEMKTNIKHTIGLSSYAVDILKEQYQYSKNSKFVFPSVIAKDGHIHRDAISKAMRNLGHKDKYKNRVTAHGFRATFKTICTLNLAELLKIGITREVVESCLAHKEHNKIIEAYQREKTTIENKIKLMQWYGDYLNKLEGIQNEF